MTLLPAATRADRLASLLQDGVTAALAQRLLEAAALRPRLDALVSDRLGLDNPGLDDPELDDPGLRHVVTLAPARLDQLCSRAGSVWHAADVLGLLDGGAVRALAAELGFDPRPLAARLMPLAPSPTRSDAPLAERIVADGRHCLAAWCASLPGPANRYAELCLPPDALPGEAHGAHGPRIIDALLSEAAA